MYKYSAFTENTPEMREWLHIVGYTMSFVTMEEQSFVKTQANGKYFETNDIPKTNIVVDCRSNPKLFKAVTAAREDSDYMQWFHDAWGYFRLCTEEHNTFSPHANMYKATLEELINHFK